MNDTLTPGTTPPTSAAAATPGPDVAPPTSPQPQSAGASPWDAAATHESTASAAATASPEPLTAAPASDPWASAEPNTPTAPGAANAPADAGTDPWASPGDAATPGAATADPGSANAADAGGDWLSATPSDASPDSSGLQRLFDGSLPLSDWINQGLDWTVSHFRPAFQALRVPIDATLGGVEHLLTSAPAAVVIGLIALLAWQFSGLGMAVFSVLALAALIVLGIWPDAMVTLSLVLTALVFCVLIGLPLGILVAASDRAQRIIRPLLDAMQTTPSFVYLVPVVMLFGIGNVPGVIVTTIFALPPLVRLTNLGIRQVRPDLIEAAKSYGASRWQLLTKVQLPLALPSIMAGVNQALMLSLSMVVVASMIAVTGLGQMVLRGIGRLDMGMAAIGGLGVVLLAVTLDRITQAMGTPRKGVRHWWQAGPAGLLLRTVARLRQPADAVGQAPTTPQALTP